MARTAALVASEPVFTRIVCSPQGMMSASRSSSSFWSGCTRLKQKPLSICALAASLISSST